MHVLVTGAGFGGTHLAVHLANRGFEVTAVARDRVSTFPTHLLDGSTVRSIDADLETTEALPTAVDAIIHTASSSPWLGKTSDDIVRDNIIAMFRLIAYARERQVRSFVFLSSISVYGRIDSPVVDEQTPIQDPDLYGMTKRVGEQMLAGHGDDMASLILRLPGLIGPRSQRNWLTRTRQAIAEGLPITIASPDASFNNAVHIKDLGDFIEGCLGMDLSGTDVVNLGAAGAISISDAIARLMRGLGRTVRMETTPPNSPNFTISSDLAMSRYGYRPMEIGAMIDRFAKEEI